MRKLKKWFMRRRNRNPNAPIPDIPKFEDRKLEKQLSKKEGSSEDASAEEAASGAGAAEAMEGPQDTQVISNGTDTYDVAEHDDIFDTSGPADHTHSDDDYEFEHDERMVEEEDHDDEVEDEEGYQEQEQVEVEDIFKNDLLATPSDFQPEKSSEVHNDVEDIFQEVGHADAHEDINVEDDDEENHDYEPVSFTERVKDEPVIQITFVDAEKSHPAINLGSLEQNANAELDLSSEELDVPFPDVSNKSDISLTWDADEEEEEGEEKSNLPIAPSSIETMPAASLADPSGEQGEEEIDESEVAKFVENILNNSMREVNLASEQESQPECEEDAADVQESEPAERSQERPIESEIVCAQEVKVESSPNVDLFSKLFVKEEEQSVSMETPSSECVDNSAQSLQKSEEKEDIHHALPVSVGEQTKEDKEEALVAKSNEKETLPTSENSIIGEGTASVNRASESSSKDQDFAESRTRKMSVPRPRDVRKDLSETRPSFFGSGSTGSASFLSNTLPRVSVLPRISTTYRKPLTSPVSVDLPSPEKEELPTVEKPDLSKDDTQVISGLTIDLPQVEALSPEPPKSPRKSDDYILPTKESTVCSSPLSPVFASNGANIDSIILDGTSTEEMDAIFAKDPEPEPEDPKKSMGKDDVIASTRVRKISRTTWRGQDEYQKSVDKSKVVLDLQQAASLKRYEERKKQRQEAFVGRLRKREDSTSEAESEGSTSSTPRSTPKMPDVVLALQAKDGKPQAEIVAPKLNLKSVRSLWEQKAAEQEQRRRALQPKRRPMSQGDGARSAGSKANYKPADNIDNSLDDSLDGNTTFSYDGASDDSSSKRESLIERDIRLAKERDLEQMKERERLRSESTSSSRDESQQSETSESQDDQGVDIVRDAELRRDSDDGRSSPSQSSGYTSGRSTPSTPAGDDIHKGKSSKSSSKMADLKEPLSPTEVEAEHASYKKYQEALKAKDGRFATFPRSKESKVSSSSVSPTNSVGDVPDVIMVDGHSTAASEKSRKTSLVKQGIMLSQSLEKKKIKTLEKKPRRSLMELEIAAQREKEEAFRREQKTARKISTSSSPKISAPSSPLLSPRADGHGSNTDISLHISSSSSASSSTATSPSSTPQGSPRKTSVSGVSAKKVYKDLNYAPQNKKKMALAQHWEHKWTSTDSAN